MLVRLLILLIFLIIAFGYLGAKISVYTENFKHSYIFWGLYIVTIITVIEIIFCIMMYVKYRTKEGEIGPRGFDGYPGQQGDDGKCNQKRCRVDLITLMLVRKLEDKLSIKLTETEIRKIFNYIYIDNNKKNKIDNMKYKELKKLDNDITYQIEVSNELNNILNDDNNDLNDKIKNIIDIIQ